MLQRLEGTGGCITFFSGFNAIMIYTHTFIRWTSLEEPAREHSISLESIFLVTSWRSASYLPPLTAVPFPCLRFSLNPNSFREESWDSTFMSLWCCAPLASRRHFRLAAGFPKVSFAGYLTTKANPFFCTAFTTLPPSICVCVQAPSYIEKVNLPVIKSFQDDKKLTPEGTAVATRELTCCTVL